MIRAPFSRLALAGALALAAFAAERTASAYCFTYDCDPASGTCPDDESGCPGGKVRLRWPVNCLGFSVQKDGSSQVSLATFLPIADQAFASWTNQADCGGGKPPSISIKRRDEPVACAEQEYNQKGGNANIVMFRDEVWPYTGADNTLALTTLTFNTETGEIYDADMEINGTPRMRITTGDVNVDKDLLSIVTHEAGHFLGIAHTQRGLHPQATMFASYDAGTVGLRDLDDDDRQAICGLYPSDEIRSECDASVEAEPRHGYSSECGGGETEEDGCHAATPGRRFLPWPAFALAGLVGLAALGRRRRGRSGSARP